jgi:uncharacterized protein (DUF2336 family)
MAKLRLENERSAGVSMTTTQETSHHDLSSSIDAPSWAVRAKCAERIARGYCEGRLDSTVRRDAEEALRRLAVDVEIVVRRLLAETLKAEARLPRDIAVTLGSDKPEVACPFLAETPVLDDADFIVIVRDHPGRHRLAIAGRRNLSSAVSGALCRSEEPGIAAAVLANKTAQIGATTLRRLLECQPDRALADAIARRCQTPHGVGEIARARRPDGSRLTEVTWARWNVAR